MKQPPGIMGTGEEPKVRVINKASDVIKQDDHNSIIVCDSGGAQTVALSGPILKGFSCVVVRKGAGTVTLSGSNVQLNSVGGLMGLSAQYAAASIISYENGFAIVQGSLA